MAILRFVLLLLLLLLFVVFLFCSHESEGRHTDRETDRQTTREAGRQTDRETDILTERQTNRQKERQADRLMDMQTDRQTLVVVVIVTVNQLLSAGERVTFKLCTIPEIWVEHIAIFQLTCKATGWSATDIPISSKGSFICIIPQTV